MFKFTLSEFYSIFVTLSYQEANSNHKKQHKMKRIFILLIATLILSYNQNTKTNRDEAPVVDVEMTIPFDFERLK